MSFHLAQSCRAERIRRFRKVFAQLTQASADIDERPELTDLIAADYQHQEHTTLGEGDEYERYKSPASPLCEDPIPHPVLLCRRCGEASVLYLCETPVTAEHQRVDLSNYRFKAYEPRLLLPVENGD